MTRALARVLLASLLLATLAGCTMNPPAPETAGWSIEDITPLDRFVVRGKVGFRRGETGGSAALTWQQDRERYRLSANGPLGQGAVRITGDAARVRIENSEGARESDTPEALLAEAIGWPVSINSLSFWVRGLPAPGSSADVTFDAEGRPARITQQEWQVVLDRYREDAGHMLPHRVVATGGDSRVTLLIERWEFPPLPGRKAAAPAPQPAEPQPTAQ